jgi:hypothetical protein
VLPDIEEFPFELELKNYHDLRCRSAVPRVLVVLSLPSNPDEWLEHTGEGLITRRCAYWHNLAGAPETENQRSRTVRISRRNALSPASLTALMRKVSRQEEIGHAL